MMSEHFGAQMGREAGTSETVSRIAKISGVRNSMKSISDAQSVNFDNEPEFRADILRRIGEMQSLSWKYSQKHGAPTFFQDKVAFRLPTAQMADAKLIGYRGEVSRFLSPDCVIAEIGTWKGDFAKHLIETCAPKKLYTIDLTYLRFNHEIMDDYVDRGVLQTIEGNSSLEIAKFPDAYFDFIYVDGDHSYNGILKDIAASKDKVKPGGLLAFNDYTNWSVFQFERYGTMAAVAEFAVQQGWPVAYFALDPHGYHDIAFRRPS